MCRIKRAASSVQHQALAQAGERCGRALHGLRASGLARKHCAFKSAVDIVSIKRMQRRGLRQTFTARAVPSSRRSRLEACGQDG